MINARQTVICLDNLSLVLRLGQQMSSTVNNGVPHLNTGDTWIRSRLIKRRNGFQSQDLLRRNVVSSLITRWYSCSNTRCWSRWGHNHSAFVVAKNNLGIYRLAVLICDGALYDSSVVAVIVMNVHV